MLCPGNPWRLDHGGVGIPSSHQGRARRPQRRGPAAPWATGVFAVAAIALTVYLLAFHWLHVLDALPYVFVIGMMGMHLFGHGHGGHGGQEGAGPREGDGHVH